MGPHAASAGHMQILPPSGHLPPFMLAGPHTARPTFGDLGVVGADDSRAVFSGSVHCPFGLFEITGSRAQGKHQEHLAIRSEKKEKGVRVERRTL